MRLFTLFANQFDPDVNTLFTRTSKRFAENAYKFIKFHPCMVMCVVRAYARATDGTYDENAHSKHIEKSHLLLCFSVMNTAPVCTIKKIDEKNKK